MRVDSSEAPVKVCRVRMLPVAAVTKLFHFRVLPPSVLLQTRRTDWTEPAPGFSVET